ncbi:MAG: hypothetical protein MZV64_25090 [Ignavibacteriales bacterium]|nr:hypothetical protein [Ignavibacteriales bacterium]
MSRFDAARRAALMQDLLRPLKGLPADLLPFDAVREGLRLGHLLDRGVMEVPLDQIVGSLGRERDFTREFLPRDEALRDRREEPRRSSRWGPPALQASSCTGSGRRTSWSTATIACRWPVPWAPRPSRRASRSSSLAVTLSPDESLDEVLAKRNLAEFCEVTGLSQAASGDFVCTQPTGHARLLEHIAAHRYFMGMEWGREPSWSEAVSSWLVHVYRPMVATIRASSVLNEFPGHTETDLYLFIMDHLHHLRERYAGKEVSPVQAARHFRFFFRPRVGLGSASKGWWRRVRTGRKGAGG